MGALPIPNPTRRAMLGALTGAVAAVCCGDHLVDALSPAVAGESAGLRGPDVASAPLVTVADGLAIHRRSDWGADLSPRGALFGEDVRFLLVHHSATSNSVPDPRSLIRGIYSFHTGSSKGWADVAYNFFVAPDGSVWEGRAGSLDGAVRADATGGNQGFSQLVCLLGNHVDVPPTAAAQQSLVRVLAWLTERYSLGVHADASATFTSRGSNKFPAGRSITTPIVSAHRDVTFTLCPGDAAIALLPTWRRGVYDIVSAGWEKEGLQRADRSALRPPGQ